MEVAVVALRVEVGDTRGELDSREDATFGAVETALFGSGLLAGIGERFNGWRSIFRYRRGPATARIARKSVDVSRTSLNGL
jgi:hypothetical protein